MSTDYNLATGVAILAATVLLTTTVRYVNGGVKPVGDWLSSVVYTRLGLAPKSWLTKKLSLATVLDATIGEALLVVSWLGFLAARFVWHFMANETTLMSLRVGKAFGQLIAPSLMMMFLTANRYTIWMWLSGIPHDRLIKYHRMAGFFIYALLIPHLVCMAISLGETGPTGLPLTRQLDSPFSMYAVNVAAGVVSFILLTIVVLTSLDFVRRRWWGMFYLSHFAAFPSMAAALIHNRPDNLPWIVVAIVMFWADAGLRGWMKFMRPSKVEDVEVLPGGVTKLSLSTGDSMAYDAGQYVWVGFPGLHTMSTFAFHPYSIGSAYKKGDKTYDLYIKDMGPGTWSAAVHQLAKEKGKEGFPIVRVGGPAGRLEINPSHFPSLVLIGGGVGMVPLVSLLQDVLNHKVQDSKEEDSKQPYASVKRVVVVWSVQTQDQLSWFTGTLQQAASAKGVEVDLRLHVTRGGQKAAVTVTQQGAADGSSIDVTSPLHTKTQEAKTAVALGLPATHTGRPDVHAILSTLQGQGPVGIYACGPPALLESTEEAVHELNKKGDTRYFLHEETFLW